MIRRQGYLLEVGRLGHGHGFIRVLMTLLLFTLVHVRYRSVVNVDVAQSSPSNTASCPAQMLNTVSMGKAPCQGRSAGNPIPTSSTRMV